VTTDALNNDSLLRESRWILGADTTCFLFKQQTTLLLLTNLS